MDTPESQKENWKLSKIIYSTTSRSAKESQKENWKGTSMSAAVASGIGARISKRELKGQVSPRVESCEGEGNLKKRIESYTTLIIYMIRKRVESQKENWKFILTSTPPRNLV